MGKMVNICADVPPETHAKLRYIMVASGFRSLKQLLKNIVQEYVDAYYAQQQSVGEAVAEAS